jgi:Protein of unknown function (DUF2934)
MSATVAPSEFTKRTQRASAIAGIERSIPDGSALPLNPVALVWREEMIRRVAYYRSLQRQPCLGKELEDWLAAEREIDDLIACGGAPYA